MRRSWVLIKNLAEGLACHFAHRCWSRYPMKFVTQRGIRKENSSLSLYPKIFDYSLGGYYHRERWPRTRRYYQTSYYVMDEGRKIYWILYSKHVFEYSLGATIIGSAGHAPDKFFKFLRE
jgi:hypothetical protein